MLYGKIKLAAFKPTKYNYALLEYLAEELKSNNIKCRKKVSRIDIKMDNLIDDKYDNLIIDCFDGKVYLRGRDLKDKKVMSLRRFSGTRESDAMYCAKGACKQIMRYLERMCKNITKEATSSTMIDYRNRNIVAKKKNFKDYRNKVKIANKIKPIDCRSNIIDCRTKTASLKDFRNKKIVNKRSITADTVGRDFAIVIVDGNVYEADTHAMAVSNYMKDLGIDGLEFFDRDELKENLGYNFYSQFAAAEYVKNEILLDNVTLENITVDQAVKILQEKYQDINIVDRDTGKILNKEGYNSVIRLKKLSDMLHDNG